MDTRDNVPKIMAMALGGMIMAIPPVPNIGPRVMDLLYPRRVISGTSKEPSMAVLAMVDPLKFEKMVPPATVSKLSRPGSRPF